MILLLAIAAAGPLDELAALPVRAPDTHAGYTRSQFGRPWADTDGDGCNTRDEVLARDLVDLHIDGCTVLSGVLHDPYTGRTVAFRRGIRTSSAVQIDHVVALSAAWSTGARALSAGERRELANDPLNLVAVDGPTNAAKGDADASAWLPPAEAFWCPYAARQVAVKTRYRLWVTPAEGRALHDVLVSCAESDQDGNPVHG